MQGLQATYLLPESYLLNSLNRNFSRSLSAQPIQPLPPEFLDATPLPARHKSGETARFWKAGFPRKLPRETLGR